MGFSGGGSNVLLPHTHDGTVSQDGGPLNFNNITQSQSAAGQVFFSDGVHLQQLSLGAANDELRVNAGATAPEWYTPTPAASTWTSIYSSTGATALDTGHLSAWSAYRYIQCNMTFDCNSAAPLQLRIYDPDGNIINGAQQGTSGIFMNAFFQNANATEIDLTGGSNLPSGRCFSAQVNFCCMPNNRSNGATLGDYWVSARQTGGGSYYPLGCMGTFYIDNNGAVDTDIQQCQGIELISPGSNLSDGLVQVFGAGAT